MWYKYLPGVNLHYAVKTNSDERLLKQLVDLGQSFDCASAGEINKVIELGADPRDIIFANSCKQDEHIKVARERGVKLMTVDSV